MNPADYPLLIDDILDPKQYGKLKPPYKLIVDSFLKNGKLMMYSAYRARNPHQATYFFILEGRPDIPVYSTLGSDDGKGKLVADTKARLSLLANKATSGDKVSQKKWETAKTNYETNKKRASGGDPKAKAIVEILEATELFVK
jgi:hypothetical protein